MSEPTYQAWCQANPEVADCENCGTITHVGHFQRMPFSPGYHQGTLMRLCFICASVRGANATEYPQQHLYHDTVVQPILGAISLLLRELKPVKKPRQPRQPKGKLSVMPMAPRTRGK